MELFLCVDLKLYLRRHKNAHSDSSGLGDGVFGGVNSTDLAPKMVFPAMPLPLEDKTHRHVDGQLEPCGCRWLISVTLPTWMPRYFDGALLR